MHGLRGDSGLEIIATFGFCTNGINDEACGTLAEVCFHLADTGLHFDFLEGHSLAEERIDKRKLPFFGVFASCDHALALIFPPRGCAGPRGGGPNLHVGKLGRGF